MDRVSVITRDRNQPDDIAGADVRENIGNKADEGATVGALSGGALGGLTGLLVGLGTLAIPGIGPIMLAGATATTLATTLAGGAIGAVTGGLLGALIGLGIPEERARVYQDRVARGEYLVIVDGTDAEIAKAEAILRHRGIEEYGIYDSPDNVATSTTPVPARTVAPVTTAGVTPPLEPVGTDITRRYQAVGFFPRLEDAEHAVTDLRSVGFPLSQISLIARRFPRQQGFSGMDLRDRFEAMRLGIPVETARAYEGRLDRGDYMVVVNGNRAEVDRAATVLDHRGIQDWHIFDPTRVSDRIDEPVYSDPNSMNMPVAATAPVAHTAIADPTRLTNHRQRAVGVFPHRRDAEAALTALRDAGFPMNQVSVIAKDADRNDAIAGVDMQSRTGNKLGNKADEGAKAGATTGGILGGLGGLLVGLGTLAIPGVGPVILGGAAATAIATTLSGGAIGAAAGGLGGALVGLGIPEDRAKLYNQHIERGDYLVIIDGTASEVQQADGIMHRHNIQDWGIYNASDVQVGDRNSVGDRSTDPDANPFQLNDDPRVVRSQPDVVVVDHRDETRL
jgi:hypothetical protein